MFSVTEGSRTYSRRKSPEPRVEEEQGFVTARPLSAIWGCRSTKPEKTLAFSQFQSTFFKRIVFSRRAQFSSLQDYCRARYLNLSFSRRDILCYSALLPSTRLQPTRPSSTLRRILCQQRKGSRRDGADTFAQSNDKMDPRKVSIFKTYEKPRGQGGSGSFATFMIIGREFLFFRYVLIY